ncbi:hypothetical protein [Profundibacter sp.]|uniref:hypothetical protein n=1 Tax=Profundibacter sp. TaxID=3101071 RepID=UPI003D0E2E50
MQFRNQHNSPQRANDPLHMEHVGVVRAFFMPAFVLVTILVGVLGFIYASDYLNPVPIMLIAIGAGLVSGLMVLKSIIRNRQKHLVPKTEEMRRVKEAEKQKQIDAMLRENSDIPKVTK